MEEEKKFIFTKKIAMEIANSGVDRLNFKVFQNQKNLNFFKTI